MSITILGEARFASPQQRTINDQARVSSRLIRDPDAPPAEELLFELAGPRTRLFFDPQQTCAGIVTCGGLCPGLNNVIRSLFLELHYGYGVQEVLGFRGGYQGLDPARGLEPVVLTPAFVHDIHKDGGTVLGTSRGPVDISLAVDNLIQRGVNILFTIGGDGTQRGGNDLFQEARRRGHPLAVVGIPKTIDNDVAFVSRTFGYLTAVEQAAKVLHCAHTEAHSVHNGIALVKLMGRHAGFIAAGATVASQDVNFTLVPEVPFQLDGDGGLLVALKERILRRAHAVIAVAEGAGQELLAASSKERDASGNAKLQDIGLFLRERIERYFQAEGIPVTLRYFDPSYLIRSVPADAEDSIMCDFFARNAVHAAMAGKTGLVIGLLHDTFIHVPIDLLVSQKKRLDLNGLAWRAVLAATGQTFDAKAGGLKMLMSLPGSKPPILIVHTPHPSPPPQGGKESWEISQAPESESLAAAVDLLAQAGSLLLQHGADAGRVEASLQQMEPGLGIERIDAVVMSKTILLTATRRDAHHTRVVRVPIVGVNLNNLSEVEQLLGRFQQGRVTPEQLALELQRIAALPHHYSRPVTVAAVGLACAAFCQLFGGDWAALAITGVAAAVAAWVRMWLNQWQVNYFLVVLLTALVASLLAGSALWFSQTPQSALTAAVLLLVPGVPLISASVDILRGHISAGLARVTTSLVVFLGIALGLGIVVRLLQVEL